MATQLTQKFKNIYDKVNGKINPLDYIKNVIKDVGDKDVKYVNVIGVDKTGIAGFKFNAPKMEQVVMQSNITNHYVETNTPVQDHIAKEPIQITLQGFQGDYFYAPSKIRELENIAGKIIPTLNLVKSFIPKFDVFTQQQKTKTIAERSKTLSNMPTGWETSINIANMNIGLLDAFTLCQQLYKFKSEQARAFFFLELLWKSQILFSVETSWRRYDNMVIKTLKPLRDNNADITDFTVTFQQLQFTASTVIDRSQAGRTRQQMAEIANKGTDKGKLTTVSEVKK